MLHFGSSSKVDVIFDNYSTNSTGLATRHRRAGHSRPVRRIVTGRDIPLPVQWPNFMTENKADLTLLLSKELTQLHISYHQELITAGGFDDNHVYSSTGRVVTHLHSTHKEADTRILLHAADAAKSGYNTLLIESPDTDVLVLLVHHRQHLVPEVWMHAEMGDSRRYILVHKVHHSQPKEVSEALLGFHAISGCDTTSNFSGYGKKLTWKSFLKQPSVLSEIGIQPFTDKTMSSAERFVIKLYYGNSNELSINELRTNLLRVLTYHYLRNSVRKDVAIMNYNLF